MLISESFKNNPCVAPWRAHERCSWRVRGDLNPCSPAFSRQSTGGLRIYMRFGALIHTRLRTQAELHVIILVVLHAMFRLVLRLSTTLVSSLIFRLDSSSPRLFRVVFLIFSSFFSVDSVLTICLF